MRTVASPARGAGPAGANAALGALILLGAEAMYFAGLVSAFIVLRAGVSEWPPPDQPRLPVGVTALSTVVLLLSGYTMARARRAIREGRVDAFARGLAATAALAATFLAMQGVEWARLLREGLRLASGPYGGLFLAVVGSHALHVAVGLAAVLITWIGAYRGRFAADRHGAVTALQLYWSFVVGVWVPIYLLVYLW